ncbi:MAG: glycosyltransferase family 2 protein [Candidatus Peregrinibacteria bacterium]|nr:glycosyltransferase family 2 protein [Candidatus Peregrinibacteria bacterium]MDZ4244329.1 glycosyltransferase family 2 protein [Candidatus Gracilibacteria bacterium]
MLKKNMKLSVIIVNYNHKYFPRLALEALEKSKTDFEFEVIFVDNNSDPADESIGFLRDAAKENRIILIESPKNIGFGAGNNLGIKKSNGEYILLHNPDTTVLPNSLQQMVDYLAKHSEVGLLGPKLVYSNGDIQDSCRRFMRFSDLIIKRTPLRNINPWKKRLKHYLMEDFDHNKTQPVDLITGAMMLARRDFLWDKLHGFDERYFLFMEDFDLCQRTWAAGKEVVYYSDVSILHYHKRLSGGGFFGQFMKKTFWLHLISSAKYFWRWRKR